MSEFRPFLDREAHRVDADPGALDGVLRRAGRRRLVRRVTTGAVALAVAGASLGLAFAAFRPDRRADLAGPVVGPTPSSPAPVVPGILVSDGSSTEGADEFTAAFLRGEAAARYISVTVPATHRAVTTIHCHPNRETEALRLRDEFFPGAELRPRVDPDTLLVTVGDDFVQDNGTLFEDFMTVRSFMTRRVEGSGAEALLSEDVAGAYAEGTEGLDLYAYAEGGRFDVRSIYRAEGGISIATVLMQGTAGRKAETLTVGDSADGRRQIVAALVAPVPERGDPDVTYIKVRLFVDGFLEARRERSGAGTYLGEDARAAYAARENGLNLLAYAIGPGVVDARVVRTEQVAPHRYRVVIRFDLEGPDTPPVYETLLIGWRGGDEFEVLDAERGRP
jgi:hypothetical protein